MLIASKLTWIFLILVIMGISKMLYEIALSIDHGGVNINWMEGVDRSLDPAGDRKIPDLYRPKDRDNNGVLFQQMLQSTHNYPVDSCKRTILVIAFIVSSPNAFQQRMSIRSTWTHSTESIAGVLDKEVLKIFVMGLPNGRDADIQRLVSQESESYGDILQGHFKDTVKNSTVKYMMALKWATHHCQDAKFVYWGDDKLVVIYRNLVAKLRHYANYTNGHENTGMAGMWMGRTAFVERQQEHRPQYCMSKTGFVLNMKAVKDIDPSVNWDVMFSTLPDVFTSTVAEKHRWTLVDVAGFISSDVVFPDNGCDVITFQHSSYERWKKIRNSTAGLRNCSYHGQDRIFDVSQQAVSNQVYLNDIYGQMNFDDQDACSNVDGQHVFMVAIITSRVGNFENRDAIRQTWAREKEVLGEKIAVLFAVGIAPTTAEQGKITKEKQEHGDIIQGHFVDSYRNLTLKTIMGLKWVTEHCSDAKYFFKGDDDVFVNVYNIIVQLKYFQANGEMLHNCIMGNVHYNSTVLREGKWRVSEALFNGQFYPPYCSGAGYVMTSDLAPLMYNLSLSTTIIPVEDAFIGVLGKKLHTHLISMPDSYRFEPVDMVNDTCSLRNSPNLIVNHGFETPSKMLQIWLKYTDPEVICDGLKAMHVLSTKCI